MGVLINCDSIKVVKIDLRDGVVWYCWVRVALRPWGDVPISGQGWELTKMPASAGSGCEPRGRFELLGCPGLRSHMGGHPGTPLHHSSRKF